MTDQRQHITDVDDLLRRACADDLPDDVAAAMGRRVDAFLAGARVEQRTMSSRAWILPRFAWAALSILMLIAGLLLQGAKASTPLAGRIASVKTAYANLEETRR